jgi:hypothetical protein
MEVAQIKQHPEPVPPNPAEGQSIPLCSVPSDNFLNKKCLILSPMHFFSSLAKSRTQAELPGFISTIKTVAQGGPQELTLVFPENSPKADSGLVDRFLSELCPEVEVNWGCELPGALEVDVVVNGRDGLESPPKEERILEEFKGQLLDGSDLSCVKKFIRNFKNSNQRKNFNFIGKELCKIKAFLVERQIRRSWIVWRQQSGTIEKSSLEENSVLCSFPFFLKSTWEKIFKFLKKFHPEYIKSRT